MARTWIDIPEPVEEAIALAAEQDGLDKARWLMQAIELTLTAPQGPQPVQTEAMAEDAVADHFLSRMDPVKARVVLDCAREQKCRPYHLIASYVALALERGEYRTIVPAAQRAAEGSPAAQPIKANSATCRYCGTTFTPERPGQVLCPDPTDGSESCGRKEMLAKMRQRRGEDGEPMLEHAPIRQNTAVIAKMLNNRARLAARMG